MTAQFGYPKGEPHTAKNVFIKIKNKFVYLVLLNFNNTSWTISYEKIKPIFFLLRILSYKNLHNYRLEVHIFIDKIKDVPVIIQKMADHQNQPNK